MSRLTLLPAAGLALACLCGAPRAAETPDAAGAAAAPVITLTVEEAVMRAVEAAPRLARLAALEQAASAEERGARAERWPQVEVGAGYQRRSSVPELSIVSPTQNPGMPVQLVTIFPDIQDNYRLRAGLSWPVYTGGRMSGRIDAAAQGRTAAERERDSVRADLVLEVQSAYFDLVTARENARVLQEAIRAFEAHLADAKNREKVGLAPANEVLAVEVERDRAELDRLRAESAAELVQADLRRLLDLTPETRIETREPPVAALAAPAEIEPLVDQALAARPERAALAARGAAADAAAGAEHGARLPQVAVTGNYNYAKPNRDLVPPEAVWDQTWDVGVGVSISVLDGGRRAANEARARAQADAVREQLRDLDLAIRLEVTQRTLAWRTAEAQLTVAGRGLESAQENRRVAAERYRAGVIPSSELLDAEIALERAALAQTSARSELHLAAAALDRAVGR